jgi:hypothetical protein
MTQSYTEPTGFRLRATRYKDDVYVAWFERSSNKYLGSLWMTPDVWELLKRRLSEIDTFEETSAVRPVTL